MSRSATSLFVFGIYMIVVGLSTMFFPMLMTASSGSPSPNDVYIRITGIFVVVVGSYCILAARHEWVEFFRWSVYTRLTVILLFILFVLLGYGESKILIILPIDLLGAIWTIWALRSEHVRLLVTRPPSRLHT